MAFLESLTAEAYRCKKQERCQLHLYNPAKSPTEKSKQDTLHCRTWSHMLDRLQRSSCCIDEPVVEGGTIGETYRALPIYNSRFYVNI